LLLTHANGLILLGQWNSNITEALKESNQRLR
jgi:hypothetical protein